MCNKKNMVVASKGVVVGVVIAIVCYCLFALTSFLLFARVDFLFPMTRPKIEDGEFHFCLTYELDGVLKTVEDTIVCEFEGTYLTSTAGVERRWNTYLKSGNERITLLDLSNCNIKNEFDQIILELFFSYGNAQYYMGDEYPSAPQIGEYIECKYRNADGTIGGGAYAAEEAFEKYKIRLINWECDPPIENN